MDNMYLYSGSHAMVEQMINANRIRSFTRIKASMPGKDHTAVNTSLHTLEAHVQAVSTNRLQQALLAEQTRIANANQSRGFGRVIRTIRTSTGSLLITFGEKLSKQPAMHTPHTRTTAA